MNLFYSSLRVVIFSVEKSVSGRQFPLVVHQLSIFATGLPTIIRWHANNKHCFLIFMASSWTRAYGGEGQPLAAVAAARSVAPDMFFHATLARSFIQTLRLGNDCDVVDRLNYYYTPIMLAVACLIISAKQYGGTPIECWVNPHSRESMEEYIESFCWIQNTYWVPMYEHIPDSHEAREEQQIGYYQWVPFILIAEALMFSLPCILWRLMNWQSGLNVTNVVSAAIEARAIVDEVDREKMMASVSNSFIDVLDLQDMDSRPHPSASWLGRIKCNRIFRGHYITSLYLFIKLLYTGNIVLQFGLLNAALKSGEHFLFGFQVLSDLLAGKPWTKSGHFPRVTLCDFEVRYLANLNRYTVQCALLINIINEKVFAFFWCWYLILLVITIASTIFWLTHCVFPSERVDYILKFMQIAQSSDYKRSRKLPTKESACAQYIPPTEAFELPHPYLLNKFVLEFLQSDGTFSLRLIANHAGELAVVSIVRALWKEFCERNWHEIKEFEENKAHHYQQTVLEETPSPKCRAYNRMAPNKQSLLKRNDSRKSNNSMKFESLVTIENPTVRKLPNSMTAENPML